VAIFSQKHFRLYLEGAFDMYKWIGKRCFDVFLTSISLIFFSPLFVVIALLIKIFDPGPIIFTQKRVGRMGCVFDCYKFRSMPVNTGDIPSDQIGAMRLTLVGRIIRRTNIDELPQLFNILKGDMSVVGPRPSILTQHELIELRRASGALACRPGLTGLAQVSSFDGMTIRQKANFDAQYARSISLSSDVWIILKTLGYLLKPPPVY
jgi:O-antigen biosynthesis protein WbqP